MEEQILRFVDALRQGGAAVSLSEVLDAFHALDEISLQSREHVREALRATLIKDPRHEEEFERLFHLHFSALSQPSVPPSSGSEEDPGRFVYDPVLAQRLKEAGVEASALAEAVLMGRGMALEQKAAAAAWSAGVGTARTPLQVGYFTHRTLERLGIEVLKEEIHRILEVLRRGSTPDDAWKEMEAVALWNLEALRRLVKGLVEREVARHRRALQRQVHTESILTKSFGALTDLEILQMQKEVARLVDKLRSKIARRERRRPRGRLDLRRTLRWNLRYEGLPLQLKFKRRRKKRVQVMALCDVSSSVWTASRFMLHLLYAIQEQFSSVRSFIFVSELGEVTRFFQDYPVQEALGRALKESGVRLFSYTDYGEVFLKFHEEYLGEVNGRTVVIIIGDGRNNHLPSQAWVLERIRHRAKRLIWLNPESRSTWGSGDSVMHEYAPMCHMVEECRNLKQLSRFIDTLVV
jgi:hypothetical protein